MSAFHVEFARSAAKDFQRAPAELEDRLIKAFAAIAADPMSGKPLQGPLAGLRSYRVGEHRIVYRVDAAAELVVIQRIGHRREIYR